MLYAAIADIHGNIHALRAVLADARAQGAEGYLLLGDYLRGAGFPNEVAETLRALPNVTAVLGNEDERIAALVRENAKHCRYEQWLSDFTVYQSLTQENRDWLCALPKEANTPVPGSKTLHLSHSLPLLDRRTDWFRSGSYGEHYEEAPFSLEEGMAAMRRTAELHADDIAQYPGDVCLYGHNHLQFTSKVGGKALLNPGGCGLPVDYDTRAPYALLEVNEKGIAVQLRRVEYDIEQAAAATRATPCYEKTPFWFELNIAELRAGRSYVEKFFQHLFALQGHCNLPAENDIFRRACATFQLPANSPSPPTAP